MSVNPIQQVFNHLFFTAALQSLFDSKAVIPPYITAEPLPSRMKNVVDLFSLDCF